VISSVGAERVLFASDYPHWDAKLSGSPQVVMRRPDLNSDTQRKIMGENAARLLRLDQ
jgi:predicted TIM-barrel fold metal-dependent hydrolase